jgi:hypothetical protein
MDGMERRGEEWQSEAHVAYCREEQADAIPRRAEGETVPAPLHGRKR